MTLQDIGGGEVRQLEGEQLIFRFSSVGPPNRLESFHAEGDCLLKMDGGDQQEAIRLSGETLTASFDPRAEELLAAELAGGILFTRGEERMRGERADYDAAEGWLHITGRENGRLPRLWNETVQLEAADILYAVDGQLLEAEGDVWVKVHETGDRDLGLDVSLFSPGSDNEPVYIHAERLESDLEAGITTFRGMVRVLHGENVLSSRSLWLHHESRRMEALERVTMLIHPVPGETDPEEIIEPVLEDSLEQGESPVDEPFDPLAPLQIACWHMIYDDQARFIVLDERVDVRKHKTRMVADHMEIQLDHEDNRIRHIIASTVALPGNETGLLDTRQDILATGFESQRALWQATVPLTAGMPTPGDTTTGGAQTTGGRPGLGAAGTRPAVPQVTLSQPGGRSAPGERVLYYPGEQKAVLVGIETVATIVDPRSGSAQGTSLTYHLADGKILNRANENEVTLVLLHAGTAAADVTGTGSPVSTGSRRSGGTANNRTADRGWSGRSRSR